MLLTTVTTQLKDLEITIQIEDADHRQPTTSSEVRGCMELSETRGISIFGKVFNISDPNKPQSSKGFLS